MASLEPGRWAVARFAWAVPDHLGAGHGGGGALDAGPALRLHVPSWAAAVLHRVQLRPSQAANIVDCTPGTLPALPVLVW